MGGCVVFAVSLSTEGDDVVVEVAGEVDVLTAPGLRAAVHEAIARAGTGTVVLDLAGVTFLDSSGVQALLDGYHSAMVAGGRLTVRGARGTAYRVLQIVGLTRLLGLAPDGSPPGDPLRRQ
jgi:anti-sigma B factor antagonist